MINDANSSASLYGLSQADWMLAPERRLICELPASGDAWCFLIACVCTEVFHRPNHKTAPLTKVTVSGFVEPALLDRIERCVEAEIKYKRSRFCSEIRHQRSQLEAYDKQANNKEITNESGQ
jgi:hypothetical protein